LKRQKCLKLKVTICFSKYTGNVVFEIQRPFSANQVAAWVQDMFCNFYFVKNLKIANNATTTEVREIISTLYESQSNSGFTMMIYLDFKSSLFILFQTRCDTAREWHAAGLRHDSRRNHFWNDTRRSAFVQKKPLRRGRLSEFDLLVKITCLVKIGENMSSSKSSWYELVSTRRPIILILPLHPVFPDTIKLECLPLSTISSQVRYFWAC